MGPNGEEVDTVAIVTAAASSDLAALHHRVPVTIRPNDFSLWLEEELDLGQLADRLNRIDIYTSTLQDVRKAIVRALQTAMA